MWKIINSLRLCVCDLKLLFHIPPFVEWLEEIVLQHQGCAETCVTCALLHIHRELQEKKIVDPTPFLDRLWCKYSQEISLAVSRRKNKPRGGGGG